MLTLHTKIPHADTIDGELVLPYDSREKSRLRARLQSGEEVAVFTVRGTVLRDGDLLRGEDGRVVRISAAAEQVYRVSCNSARDLLRCAFHLGNRHTQAQIIDQADGQFLRIRFDSVLKDMLQGLGATVEEENAPFEPESGAYGGGHHHHGEQNLLAPIPLRQKIHRPSDPDQA
ncbi:urease accessory protein UreE [Lacisediminimonas sp.]|uniref:urease accessory protein UreE n=1 Tax=Lacisediminimonas sp. TaxID=3060582 RepID=UPI00271A1190|nr:urease accessory protein UreE [Lacisediminimonas sp.]MDO8300958.1 urease accessory protein UreE [Lacisediminimonas sp.]